MISLVSSDSDDEDDNGIISIIGHPCCRTHLYVANTKLTNEQGGRLSFLGLFTARPIKKGSFIGFYSGDWWKEDAYKQQGASTLNASNRYAIRTSDELIVCPPMSRNRRPDPEMYPIGMANEPNALGEANSMLTEYSFCVDELDVSASKIDEDRWDDDFIAVGLIACRNIGRHREILWSYGGSYAPVRPYSVGKNCKAPSKRSLQDPLDVFVTGIPLEAVSYKVRQRVRRR